MRVYISASEKKKNPAAASIVVCMNSAHSEKAIDLPCDGMGIRDELIMREAGQIPCPTFFAATCLNSLGSAKWIIDTYIPMRRLQVRALKEIGSPSKESLASQLANFSFAEDQSGIVQLVYELISIDAWNIKNSKLIRSTDSSESVGGIQINCLQDYELIILGILEIALFHSYAVGALGLHAVDLLDYCHRKVC